jgi:hypothetical protein
MTLSPVVIEEVEVAVENLVTVVVIAMVVENLVTAVAVEIVKVEVQKILVEAEAVE